MADTTVRKKGCRLSYSAADHNVLGSKVLPDMEETVPLDIPQKIVATVILTKALQYIDILKRDRKLFPSDTSKGRAKDAYDKIVADTLAEVAIWDESWSDVGNSSGARSMRWLLNTFFIGIREGAQATISDQLAQKVIRQFFLAARAFEARYLLTNVEETEMPELAGEPFPLDLGIPDEKTPLSWSTSYKTLMEACDTFLDERRTSDKEGEVAATGNAVADIVTNVAMLVGMGAETMDGYERQVGRCLLAVCEPQEIKRE